MRTGAFLGLWNDYSAARADYDVWHTREHVPERLSVSGIVSARRYADGEGPLPPYLTLYDLRDLGVLRQPDYRRLLDHPSAWTESMRPKISRFLRLACRSVGHVGAGIGGTLAASLVRIEGLGEPALLRILQEIAAIAEVNSVRLGVIDPGVPDVPFETGGGEVIPASNGVLLVEVFAGRGFPLAELADRYRHEGLSLSCPWTTYRLAFALDQDVREEMAPIVR